MNARSPPFNKRIDSTLHIVPFGDEGAKLSESKCQHCGDDGGEEIREDIIPQRGLSGPQEVEILSKSKERMTVYLLGYLALWSVIALALLLLRGDIQEVTTMVQLLAVPVLPLLGYLLGKNSE